MNLWIYNQIYMKIFIFIYYKNSIIYFSKIILSKIENFLILYHY